MERPPIDDPQIQDAIKRLNSPGHGVVLPSVIESLSQNYLTQTENQPPIPEDFEPIIAEISKVIGEDDTEKTIYSVRHMAPEHAQYLSETMANPQTVIAQRDVDTTIAQQIVEGRFDNDADVPTILKNILDERARTATTFPTFRKAFDQLKQKLNPQYYLDMQKRIAFAKDFNRKFKLLKEDYEQTYGTELNTFQDHAIGDIMVILALRNPEQARFNFFEERLKKDMYLRNAEGDFSVHGNVGNKFFQELYERSKTTEQPLTKAEQTAWFLQGMAQTWHSRETFGIRKKSDGINVVIMHKQDDQIIPVKISLDTRGLPSIDALTETLGFLDSGKVSDSFGRLSERDCMNLRIEAYQPTALRKKSKLFQKIASNADIILHTSEDTAMSTEERWEKREDPKSLFFTFSHAVVTAQLNFLRAEDTGPLLTSTSMKFFHPDINGMPARKFARQTMLRTYNQLKSAEPSSLLSYKLRVEPVLSYSDVPNADLSNENMEKLAQIPQEIYGFGKLTTDQFYSLLDDMAELNKQKIPATIARLFPLALMLTSRPDDTAIHFIVDSSTKDKQRLDVAIATLLPPNERKKLYTLFEIYKSLHEKQHADFFADKTGELFDFSQELRESLRRFRQDVTWARSGESIAATLASIAGGLEPFLAGTANLIKEDMSDLLNAPGGMASVMADIGIEGDITQQEARFDMKAIGMSEIPVTDVWDEAYVSTARAAAYEHSGRHAGVVGVTVAHKENFDGSVEPELAFTSRLTWGHLKSEIIEYLKKQKTADNKPLYDMQTNAALSLFLDALNNRDQDTATLIRKLSKTSPLTFNNEAKDRVPMENVPGILTEAASTVADKRTQDIYAAYKFIIGMISYRT